jgi:flagellar biosynthesis GTPase FlhF
MAAESNVQTPEGVRTYRGRTLEEILPQIREELGADAIILREREGLVGGVGGFFAQRFIEVEARRGDGDELTDRAPSGSTIDIYDEDDELDLEAPAAAQAGERRLLPAGEPGTGEDASEISARRQTPTGRSEPRPFIPPELQRERIIPRDPQGEPAAPTRRFETDVFLERLREASQILPDEDEQVDEPAAETPGIPASETAAPADPAVTDPAVTEPADEPAQVEPEATGPGQADPDTATPPTRPRPARRTPPERKPRGPQQRRPRPAPRGKQPAQPSQPAAPAEDQPPRTVVDPWTVAMAALVAEPEEPGAPPPPARPRPPAPTQTPNRYADVRQRPPSLRSGLPTDSPAAFAPGAAFPAAPALASDAAPGLAAPIPSATPVAPLEIRTRREGGLRGVIARLLGGRFASTTLPRPAAAHPIDAAAATAIAAELSARGAGQTWTAQLIGTAAAHGTPLSGSLVTAAQAELARRIVPAPPLPATGAAVAFIGAGGTGKTRCTAALASAYSRASTLGVVVIAVDNPGGARELTRLLEGDGVPVLSLDPARAAQAVAAYRPGGFVIIDTPTATPTDPAALEALGASLAPLELDAAFVTLPATLGPQAARRALAGFGRLNPSAVAITHADETDQLAVVVEIAIANRIPLAYLHGGTDHRSAISAVEAGALARQLLAS